MKVVKSAPRRGYHFEPKCSSWTATLVCTFDELCWVLVFLGSLKRFGKNCGPLLCHHFFSWQETLYPMPFLLNWSPGSLSLIMVDWRMKLLLLPYMLPIYCSNRSIHSFDNKTTSWIIFGNLNIWRRTKTFSNQNFFLSTQNQYSSKSELDEVVFVCT